MLKVYTFFIFLIKKCCCFIKTSKNLQFLCGRVGSESFDGRKFDKRSCKHCRRNIFFLPEQIILYALQRVWLYQIFSQIKLVAITWRILLLSILQVFFCARSDYFKALLSDHFCENSQDIHSIPVVTLHDITAAVFSQIVYYLYTNRVEVRTEKYW